MRLAALLFVATAALADQISIEVIGLSEPSLTVSPDGLVYADPWIFARYRSDAAAGNCYDPCSSFVEAFDGGSIHLAGSSGTNPIGGYDVFTYCGDLPVNPFQELCWVDGTIDGRFVGPVSVSTNGDVVTGISGDIQFEVLPSLAEGLGISAGEYAGTYRLENGQQFIVGDSLPAQASALEIIASTPEPASIALLGTIFLALAVLKRRFVK